MLISKLLGLDSIFASENLTTPRKSLEHVPGNPGNYFSGQVCSTGLICHYTLCELGAGADMHEESVLLCVLTLSYGRNDMVIVDEVTSPISGRNTRPIGQM